MEMRLAISVLSVVCQCRPTICFMQPIIVIAIIVIVIIIMIVIGK